MKTDVVIIGGGAAGLLAAGKVAERGLSAILLEPGPKTGRKLRITGKGRCNITNNCSVRECIENIPGNGNFLYGCLNTFTPQDTMKFFEDLGIPLKTERGGRVFPVSDRAGDIADALLKYARDQGVVIRRLAAKRIIVKNDEVNAVLAGERQISCDAAILCTGGLSYPATGSKGDGYRMAGELGHTVIEPRPSLIPLVSSDWFCPVLQGLTLKNVTLSVYDSSGSLVFRELGEMLFTHFGVSGPLVLSASAHMRCQPVSRYRLSVDLKPGLDERKLDARMIQDFKKNSNRDLRNSLSDLAAKAMIPVIVERSEIPGDTKVNSLTRQQRNRLREVFKDFRITVSGTRHIDEAIITSGGIDVREINPKTMGSKIVRGLYFAGEILDVDGFTGGFNLQIAWSTANSAATWSLS